MLTFTQWTLPNAINGLLSSPSSAVFTDRFNHHHRAQSLLGSLRKHDVDGSENVIWKCNFAFLQSFLNYSKSLRLKKGVLTIWELNWNQRFGVKKTKLNICYRMVTSSTQLQNRSFHVAERTTTSAKCQKLKMHVQSVRNYCFSLSNMQICDFLVAIVVMVA